MADYFAILTATGQTREAATHAAGGALKFTHVAIGSGDPGSIETARTRTTLVKEEWRGGIKRVAVDKNHADQIVIECIVPADVGSWWMREMMAFDSTGTAVAIARIPDSFKPTAADGATRTPLMRMVIKMSHASVVTLMMDPNLVTHQDILDEITVHEAKADPHPQYLTAVEGDQRFDAAGAAGAAASAARAAHEQAVDPHPQYTTPAEAASAAPVQSVVGQAGAVTTAHIRAALAQDFSAKADLVNGQIPAAQLPGFVDDVLEYANQAAFPAGGESGKLYVAIDTGKTYRWSGSGYVEISPSPGSTDAVTEGANNLYFTYQRVRGTVLTGLSVVAAAAISASDTLLGALAKLQAQIILKLDAANPTSTGVMQHAGPASFTGGVAAGQWAAGKTTGMSTPAAGNYWVCVGRFNYAHNVKLYVTLMSTESEEVLVIESQATYYAAKSAIKVARQSYNCVTKYVGVSSGGDAQDKYLWINVYQPRFAISISVAVEGVGFFSYPNTISIDGAQPTQRVLVDMTARWGAHDASTYMGGDSSSSLNTAGALSVGGTARFAEDVFCSGIYLNNAGVIWGASEGVRIMNHAATAHGTLQVYDVYIDNQLSVSGKITNGVMRWEGRGFAETATASDSEQIYFNYSGYQNGFQYYRDFRIYDGKSNPAMWVQGSSRNATFYGNVYAAGGVTLPVAASDAAATSAGVPSGALYWNSIRHTIARNNESFSPFADNDFFIRSDGRIEQFGVVNIGTVGGGAYAIGERKTISITFPTSFPHACRNVEVTAMASDDGVNGNGGRGSGFLASKSLYGAEIGVDSHMNNYSANFFLFWRAIGD